MKILKQTLSALVGAAIALSCAMPAFAADSDLMQEALASVKQRIDIPAELNVFRSGVSSNEKETLYNFSWTNEYETKTISVRADDKGRTEQYSYYEDSSSLEPSLSDTTKDEAIALADAFIRKAAPELFQNPDDLLVNTSSAGSSGMGTTWYTVNYLRKHNGTEVLSNSAYVNVTAYLDRVYVSNMHISWDYDTDFDSEDASLENTERVYFDTFPLELSYKRLHQDPMPLIEAKDGTKIQDGVVMQYAFAEDAGYISAKDGAKLEPDVDDEIYKNAAAVGGSSSATMYSAMEESVAFSPEELAELERVEGLISDEDAEKIIRAVSQLKMTSDMTLTSVNISRQRPWYFRDDNNVDNENFVISLRFNTKNEDNTPSRSLYATLDAKTGEILSISNYSYNEEKTTSSSAEADIDAFLNTVAKDKLSLVEDIDANTDNTTVYQTLRRIVNGIPYQNNYISYSYDKDYSRISSYYIEWDEYTDHFKDPADALSKEQAEEKILAFSPLKLIYIKNNGIYKLCYTISEPTYYTAIDAITGEQLNKNTADQALKTDYTDIAGHWAEDAIRRLADAGLCQPSTTFMPDSQITQKDLLTFLASVFRGGTYWDYDEDSLYDMLIRNNYISESEKNPSAPVLREDAFVFMIRFMGYERVAKLSGIFNCPFSDANEISPEKLGYAAILSGFGVISGDASQVRANDNITRAETAMMLYKYLTYRD